MLAKDFVRVVADMIVKFEFLYPYIYGGFSQA